MHPDIDHILISEEELQSIVTELAKEIDRDYNRPDKHLMLLCILKGSIVFMGDLMKKLTVSPEIDCMKVSSYGRSTESNGSIHIDLDLIRPDLSSCDILIVEDIIDSGTTLKYLTEYLLLKGARSVRSVTLLDKPSRRKVDFTPDYVGKIVPDEFVVGYGLDFSEKYRALPYVGVLKAHVYSGG